MSVTLTSQPAPLSFVRNHNAFRFAVSAAASQGSTARYSLFVSSSFPSGGTVTISLNGRSLTFTRRDVIISPSPFAWTSVDELRQLLASNFYLADLFSVADPDPSDSDSSFYLVARQPGLIQLSFSSSASRTFFRLVQADPGADPQTLPNYSILARFLVDGFQPTPWLSFFPSGGSLSIPTDILAGFFPAPDLPAPGSDFALQLLSASILSYRLQWCESYGDSPLARLVSTSPSLLALPGELAQASADSNLPDWNDLDPSRPISSNGRFWLRVIGEDTRSSLDIPLHSPHFLYLFALDSAQPASASLSVNPQVRFSLSDGSSLSLNLPALSLANGALYRLPVGPDVILPLLPDSSPSPLYYSIHLFHPNGTCAFRRSYHPVPSHFFRHTLLLQNKYGLLSAFSPMSVAAATVVEGDKYRLQHRLGFSISSASQLFTATSQMLRRSEAAALSASLAAPHAFARVGSQWLPIAIVPDSFTAFDESQDLVQLSFSFYFVLNQLDNLAVPLSDNTSHAILLTEDGFALTQENNAPLSV